jgi:hypothetical protein
MFNLPKKFDFIFLIIISLILISMRIPLVSKFLYEWDSNSYALAFEKYSIAHQQPHSPGYILYVALGNGVNYIFHDANTSLIFISIIISILTVILVYLMAKEIFGIKVAIASAILLIVNPLFWFYGEIATVYIFQAFFAVLIAYISYNALKKKGYFVYLSALVLGLSGGFRLDLVVLLFPLWLFCLWYGKTPNIKIGKGILVLIAGILLWFIPTVISTGSLGNYLELLSTVSSAGSTSILMGASISAQIINSGLALIWSLLGFTFLGLIFLLIFLIYHRHNLRGKLITYLKNPKSIFFLLWIAPAFLFFFLIYIIKPGYTLIYLPALVIILGYIINRLAHDMHSTFPRLSFRSFFSILLLIIVIFNSVVYLYPYNLHQEELWETPQNNLTESQKILFDINVGFMYNQEKIWANDENTMLHIKTITNLSQWDPSSTIVIIRDITREDEGFNWRKAMYYLPEYNVYYLFDSENSHYSNNVSVWLGKNHTDVKIEASTYEIHLNSSVRRIVWIMSNQTTFYKEVQSIGNLQTITLTNGLKIYYTDIDSGPVNLKVSEFVFER